MAEGGYDLGIGLGLPRLGSKSAMAEGAHDYGAWERISLKRVSRDPLPDQ